MEREGMPPLDPEMRDALRLELQESSPKERAEQAREVEGIYRDFISRWGHFVSDPIPEKEIASRFLDVDRETLHEQLYPHWFGKEPAQHGPSATTDMRGKVVFVRHGGRDAQAFWDAMPEEVHERLYRDNGYTDDEDALRQLKRSMDRNTTAHEVAHLLQDARLPRWFGEIGAYWYGQQSELEGAQRILEGEFQSEQAEVYGELLKEYGDNVHRVYFGSGPADAPERFGDEFPEGVDDLERIFAEAE